MFRKRWSCFILITISIASSLCEEAPSKKEEEQRLKYTKPEAHSAHLTEPFHDEQDFLKRWTLSQAKKDGMEESLSKYDGLWKVESPTENPIEDDLGLILKSEAKHGAISSPLPTKFEFDANPLFIQYEVRFQKPLECGGAYIKLLAESTPAIDLSTFGDKSVYSIMFGPDKCGHEGKMHFIIQHENPSSGKMEEHHAKVPSGDFSKMFDDKKTHLITLIVRPGNTFDILLDKTLINTGSLLNDLEPPINPPAEIDDPADVKPAEWDEREKIPDPDATKPDDWDEDAPKQITDEKAVKPTGWFDDEPEQIPDPAAEKPADWDTEEDGEWEAPLVANPKCTDPGCGEWKPPTIDNPAYKGKWVPPLISNPAYKGVWAPKKIPNPHFFEDKNPFVNIKPIVAIGYELWSMQSDILFDNIILASDQGTIDQWTAQTWDLKRKTEVAGEKGAAASMFSSLYQATEDMPWLWVVYAIVVLLPFVLIYVFCFPNKDKSATAAAADRKKTDEPCPDDVDDVDDNVSNRSVESSGEEDLMPELEKVDNGPVITDVTDEVEETSAEAVAEVEKKVEEAAQPAADEEKVSEDANEKLEKEPEKSLDIEPIPKEKESSDSPDEDEAVVETSPRATRSKKKTRKDT